MASARSTIWASRGWSVPSEVLVQCRSPTAATRNRSGIAGFSDRKMRAAITQTMAAHHLPLADTSMALDYQPPVLDPEAKAFYRNTLGLFQRARLNVLIGGAYAFARYTGIERHTKDLDVFV